MSEAPDDPLVEMAIEEPSWKIALPEIEEVATRAVALALDVAGLLPDACSVSVLACDDARITALNAAFRGKMGPTNVLSWPAFLLAPPSPGQVPPAPPAASAHGARLPLGDVAIALQTVVKEADQLGRPLKNHAMHLILHGCLHLLGYDHETPRDAELMEDIERRALARAGVPDPYA